MALRHAEAGHLAEDDSDLAGAPAPGHLGHVGGAEYNLVLIAVALGVSVIGAGEWSLGHALGIDDNGLGWGLAALGAGLLGAFIAVGAGRLYSRAHGRPRPADA